MQCLDPKVLQEETVLPLNSKGPDFMRIRPQSVIADAPLVTLDRNERVRLMSKFRVLCRRSWVSKETGKHRGLVTRTAESVFGALLYLTEKYGRVFPSLEGLAHLAMCCKQSVVTAVADLEALGFVTRIRRIRRITTPLGFTTRQITNAYRVHEPAGGLGCVASTLFATESNYSTPSRSKFIPREQATIPGRRRAQLTSRQLNRGCAFWGVLSYGPDATNTSWGFLLGRLRPQSAPPRHRPLGEFIALRKWPRSSRPRWETIAALNRRAEG